MTTTYTQTTMILPYRIEVYRPNLSATIAGLLYEHCHGSYAKRVETELNQLEVGEHEERPSQAAIGSINDLIEKVAKTDSLSEPEVSAFCGEASVTWRCGNREVTLLSRGAADDPKILRYEYRGNLPSYHHMTTNANEKELLKAIGYNSHRPHGWLYE